MHLSKLAGNDKFFFCLAKIFGNTVVQLYQYTCMSLLIIAGPASIGSNDWSHGRGGETDGSK